MSLFFYVYIQIMSYHTLLYYLNPLAYLLDYTSTRVIATINELIHLICLQHNRYAEQVTT